MQKMRTQRLPRYIKPEVINEGDVIRVTWKVLDVEHSRTSTVARIIDDGRYKLLVSPLGQEIARFAPNTRLRFTLLSEASSPQMPLFEMEGENAHSNF